VYIKNRSARSGARSARASGPDVHLRARPYASSAAFEVGADLITSSRRLGGFWIVERGRHRRAHQGRRTIGDRGAELEPLVCPEQVVEIIGLLGAERRADYQGNGKRSRRGLSCVARHCGGLLNLFVILGGRLP
jgi:hypothetical protein